MMNNPEPEMITWTRRNLESFKRVFECNVKGNRKEFTWDGHVFVTAYAKYLIEYLEGELK